MSLPPPFLSIDGIPNFRALGGQPTSSSSRVVRPNLVFRSVEPSQITPEGQAAFSNLGITHVYDLRSNVEIKQHVSAPVCELPGTERVFVPVFPDTDYGPEAIAVRFAQYGAEGPEGFVEAYRTILDAAAGPYNQILTHLASPQPTPLLVHCTAGKDRTGIICAIILALCGVDDDTIAKEYSLTEVGLGHRREHLIEHLMKSPALQGDRDKATRMVSARPENMTASLQMLREQYGSVEDYVTSHCGLAPHQVEQIRRNMTIDVSNI